MSYFKMFCHKTTSGCPCHPSCPVANIPRGDNYSSKLQTISESDEQGNQLPIHMRCVSLVAWNRKHVKNSGCRIEPANSRTSITLKQLPEVGEHSTEEPESSTFAKFDPTKQKCNSSSCKETCLNLLDERQEEMKRRHSKTVGRIMSILQSPLKRLVNRNAGIEKTTSIEAIASNQSDIQNLSQSITTASMHLHETFFQPRRKKNKKGDRSIGTTDPTIDEGCSSETLKKSKRHSINTFASCISETNGTDLNSIIESLSNEDDAHQSVAAVIHPITGKITKYSRATITDLNMNKEEEMKKTLPSCECAAAAKVKGNAAYKRNLRKFIEGEMALKFERKELLSPQINSTSPTPKENARVYTVTGCVFCDSTFPTNEMDPEKHIICQRGDVFVRKYIVQSERGRGTFGKVFECIDVSDIKRNVAVKIVRAIPKYSKSATVEASILRYIQRKDRYKTQPVIQMINSFNHGPHVALVFPLMGPSLYHFMKISKRPFSLKCIKSFGYQILKAVKFLHGIGLTHTDLKPENVVLVNPDIKPHIYRRLEIEDTRVCIIDMGSATFQFEKQSSLISTRHYRAPEVVLELGWSFACDIWSVGCILIELYIGEVYFRTHENQEHLQLMEKALGKFPVQMVKSTSTEFFARGYVKESKKSNIATFPPIEKRMKDSTPDTSRFRHLLRQLLSLDPKRRITAAAATKLAFFRAARTDASPSPTSTATSIHSSDFENLAGEAETLSDSSFSLTPCLNPSALNSEESGIRPPLLYKTITKKKHFTDRAVSPLCFPSPSPRSSDSISLHATKIEQGYVTSYIVKDPPSARDITFIKSPKITNAK